MHCHADRGGGLLWIYLEHSEHLFAATNHRAPPEPINGPACGTSTRDDTAKRFSNAARYSFGRQKGCY